MDFYNSISGINPQSKHIIDGKKYLSDEFKGIVDFCLDDDIENTDSFGGNGFEGNGFADLGGNGFEGTGFADFGGNGFEEFAGNGFEGNGFSEIGGNGENYFENYNFDEEINDFWTEG